MLPRSRRVPSPGVYFTKLRICKMIREFSQAGGEKMKRLISLMLAGMLILGGCAAQGGDNASSAQSSASPAAAEEGSAVSPEQVKPQGSAEEKTEENEKIKLMGFDSMSDKKNREYVEQTVMTGLKARSGDNDFDIVVENVEAVYISGEYLKELAYNSKENVFFGYNLSELDKKFKGQKYVFTLDEKGKTIVEPFRENDTAFMDQTIKTAASAGTTLINIAVTAVLAGGVSVPVLLTMTQPADSDVTVGEATDSVIDMSVDIIYGLCTGDWTKAAKTGIKVGTRFIWKAVSDYDIANKKLF